VKHCEDCNSLLTTKEMMQGSKCQECYIQKLYNEEAL
jgi:hypothetical protein